MGKVKAVLLMRPIKSQWSVSRAYGPAWSPCGAMSQCTQNCGLLWSGTFSHTHFTTKGHDIPWLPKTNAPPRWSGAFAFVLQAILQVARNGFEPSTKGL